MSADLRRLMAYYEASYPPGLTGGGEPEPGGPFIAGDFGVVLGEYDASIPETITAVDGRVTQIAPVSGSWGVIPKQDSAAAQPWTGTRTIGGRNALEVKGLQRLSIVTPLISTPTTVAVVFQSDLASISNYAQIYGDGRAVYAQSATRWALYAGTDIAGPTIDVAPHAFVSIYDSTLSEFWADGIMVGGPANCGGTAQTSVILGSGSGYYFTGLVGHAIYYDGRITDPAGLSAALKTRWGTT